MSGGVVILPVSYSVEPEAGRMASKWILFISIFCEINLRVLLNFLRGLEGFVGLYSNWIYYSIRHCFWL